MKKMNKKGFTIVELVIVIAVIAILSAILVPTFANVVTDAQEAAEKADFKAAYTQALADYTDDIANKSTTSHTFKCKKADGTTAVSSATEFVAGVTYKAGNYTFTADGNGGFKAAKSTAATVSDKLVNYAKTFLTESGTLTATPTT